MNSAKVKWYKMQFIDRIRRYLFRVSGRRVLIILTAIGVFVWIFNYVKLSGHSNKLFSSQNGVRQNMILIRDMYYGTIMHTRDETNDHSVHPQFSTLTDSQSDATSSDTDMRNEFITISDFPVSTENEANDYDTAYYDNETGFDYEPFQEPLFQSWNSESEDADKINSTLKNNLFTFFCKNLRVRRAQKRNKNLVVYENFIIPTHTTQCHESITYTTHGDYRYLDNLIPLVHRWNGPISVAIYSPGDDLRRTLKIINFLRKCAFYKIRKFVTFHLFFDVLYSSPVSGEFQFQWLDSMYQAENWRNCSVKPAPKQLRDEITFRMQKRLLYPINVARNIARSASTTHFVLPSDIELYPSTNIIPYFFKMLYKGIKHPVIIPARQVYVLPIFEVPKGIMPPMTKFELVQLLKSGVAIPFHSYICKECHLVPKFREWANQIPKSPTTLQVFHQAKRKGAWEPIYIGTKYEPPYDERLAWEGLRDKMTQGYILCALDYNFLILDNAFLVHRPGIKRLTHKITKTVLRQDRLINLKIKVEFFRRFGKQDGCSL